MTRSVLDILMVKVFFDSRVWIHNSLNIHFLLSKNYFYFQNVTLLLQEKPINIMFSTINCNDERAFPEKNCTSPPLRISIFLKLTPLDFQPNYRDPLKFSIFLHWAPLEIHVLFFPLSFKMSYKIVTSKLAFYL